MLNTDFWNIVKEVCDKHGVTLEEIKVRRRNNRTAEICVIRAELIYRLYFEIKRTSYSSIAKVLGYTNHSGALLLLRKYIKDKKFPPKRKPREFCPLCKRTFRSRNIEF